MHWQGIIRHYGRFFTSVPEEAVVTLLEGNTPLVPAPALARRIAPGTELYLKYEGLNPTGSFKDRGMTMAVSKAKADGSDSVICASTGNTSASAAAYAARAGMKAFVLIPEGKIALGKLSQAMIHGAQVLQVLGNFDDALALVKEVSSKYPVTLVNSLNPYRIEGQQSAAFEIVDALGDAPDYHILPVGNAGNITAYWAGYKAYRAAGKSKRLPAMLGWQAEGAAPIVRGAPVAKPRDGRHRDPDRQPRLLETGGGRARRVRGAHPDGERRGDPRGVQDGRRDGRDLLRARVRRLDRRRDKIGDRRFFPGGAAARLHADRARPEGPGQRDRAVGTPP